jgi:hypothetical protein
MGATFPPVRAFQLVRIHEQYLGQVLNQKDLYLWMLRGSRAVRWARAINFQLPGN